VLQYFVALVGEKDHSRTMTVVVGIVEKVMHAFVGRMMLLCTSPYQLVQNKYVFDQNVSINQSTMNSMLLLLLLLVTMMMITMSHPH
jgi:hypothetical protein